MSPESVLFVQYSPGDPVSLELPVTFPLLATIFPHNFLLVISNFISYMVYANYKTELTI